VYSSMEGLGCSLLVVRLEGAKGVYAQLVDVCPKATLDGTSVQLGH